jgi:hypothetical protein
VLAIARYEILLASAPHRASHPAPWPILLGRSLVTDFTVKSPVQVVSIQALHAALRARHHEVGNERPRKDRRMSRSIYRVATGYPRRLKQMSSAPT